MRGRDYFKKYRRIIVFFVKIAKHLTESCRIRLFNMFRNKNGYFGFTMRYILFASLAKKCCGFVTIHPGCFFYNIQNIEVGENVAFNQMCYIQGSGGIKIGNNVGIAHGVTIESETHITDNLDELISSQGLKYKKVIIEDDVWICAKATILCGIHIEKGSIVGANAVVTKTVFANTVVAGCPAKIIKKRGE